MIIADVTHHVNNITIFLVFIEEGIPLGIPVLSEGGITQISSIAVEKRRSNLTHSLRKRFFNVKD